MSRYWPRPGALALAFTIAHTLGAAAQDPRVPGSHGLEVEDPSVLRYSVTVLGFADDLDERRVVELVEAKVREAGIRPVGVTDAATGPYLGIWIQSVYRLALVGWAYNISFHRPVSYRVGSTPLRQRFAVTWGDGFPNTVGMPDERIALRLIGTSIGGFLEAFKDANPQP